MFFIACLILCLFSTSAILICPSPSLPNPIPGEIATFDFYKTANEKSIDVFFEASGIFAQTNIVALDW